MFKSREQYMQQNNLTNEDLSLEVSRIIKKFDHFVDMLRNQRSFFARPSTAWDDPYDAVFIRSKIIFDDGEIGGHGYRDDYYCQCWCKKKGESDAMWRIYSNEGESIMIKTMLQRLYDSFWDDRGESEYLHKFIGQVIYVPEQELEDSDYFVKAIQNPILPDGTGRNIAKAILVKHDAYKHEEEIRLIYADYKKTATVIDGKGVNLPLQISFNELVHEIVINPRAKDPFIEKVKAELSDAGYKGKLTVSNLYGSKNLSYRLSR